MRRIIAPLAVAAAVLAGAACSPHYDPGPAGKITDRSATYRSKTGGWFYYLTVDGKKFRVTRDEYRSCFRGSSYPACTTR